MTHRPGVGRCESPTRRRRIRASSTDQGLREITLAEWCCATRSYSKKDARAMMWRPRHRGQTALEWQTEKLQQRRPISVFGSRRSLHPGRGCRCRTRMDRSPRANGRPPADQPHRDRACASHRRSGYARRAQRQRAHRLPDIGPAPATCSVPPATSARALLYRFCFALTTGSCSVPRSSHGRSARAAPLLYTRPPRRFTSNPGRTGRTFSETDGVAQPPRPRAPCDWDGCSGT